MIRWWSPPGLRLSKRSRPYTNIEEFTAARAKAPGAENQAVRYCRSGQSSMVGKPKPRPPSGEASHCSRPPKTDSFKPAKSDPAIDKLAIIQSRPSIRGTSVLFEPSLVINSYRHRG